MNNTALLLDSLDNVGVALCDLTPGEQVKLELHSLEIQQFIPAKHKFALQDFFPGDEILMYGTVVAEATQKINLGAALTLENIQHKTQAYSLERKTETRRPPEVAHWKDKTFLGFHREDGQVGTANYWLFIPTVFCENRNLDVIREAMHNELGYAVTGKYKEYTHRLLEAWRKGEDIASVDLFPSGTHHRERPFKNVDGIKFLNHQGGCGGTRQDSAVLAKLLVAYADHPNVGGVTVLSLGCQHLQVSDFKTDLLKHNPGFDKPLIILEQQQSQSEEQLVAEAIRSTFEGIMEIDLQERQPATLDKLCIGVKCGGSDGFSGISANPAVGYCSDLVVALGGKILLAEFPELCGVEQELVDRSVTRDTAEKFIGLMQAYSSEAERVGSGFHMNPSPGNIRDGLITDAIKSAGAAKKGGTSPVVDVLDYTESAVKPGLSLVCTPGNDVEATTGKAASGATLILFTTGLGTPTGNPVCPTIKVSTNTKLTKRMADIIDIDCGPVIEGEKTIEEMGEDILEYCILAASGEVIPKAVLLNQDDFIPWKRGVSL